MNDMVFWFGLVAIFAVAFFAGKVMAREQALVQAKSAELAFAYIKPNGTESRRHAI